MNAEIEDTTQARPRIAAAAGGALLAAGLILVMFVLPAEYAVDPLGTGARFGLLDLGLVGQQVDALTAEGTAAGATTGQALVVEQERPFHEEKIVFTLAPREGFEYKYRLDKGEALLYSWQASVPVNSEFHAEPDGAPRGYAQTYEKIDGRREESGTLIAPFPGIHGWFWQNPTDQPITVTLTSAGFYNLAHEFRADQPVKNKMFQ